MLRRLFLLSLPLTLAVGAALVIFDAPLRTGACPNGIVSFELAGSADDAAAIMESWDPRARIYAGLGLGIDYLYLLAYGTSLGLGCLLLGESLGRKRAGATRLGRWLAYGMVGAASFDAIENYALIRVLLGSTGELWPRVAWGFAVPKFGLVILAFLFLIGGGVLWLVDRRNP